MARYKKLSNYGLWEEVKFEQKRKVYGAKKTFKLWFMGRNKGLGEGIKVYGMK